MNQLTEMLPQGATRGVAAPAVFTCSVDDGHPADLRVAAMLASHGLRGTFYVPIRNREQRPVLAAAALRELDRNFEVASHTLDHCYLDQVTLHQAQQQISCGKSALEQVLGHGVCGFCYPGGRNRRVHRQAVQNAGFTYARTTVNLHLEAGKLAWAMPTTMQFYPHSRSVLMRNMARAGAWPRRMEACLLALQHTCWIERIEALIRHAAAAGRVCHLWCHGWEIEQLDAWQAFDRVLATASRCFHPEQCLTNGDLADITYRRRATAAARGVAP